MATSTRKKKKYRSDKTSSAAYRKAALTRATEALLKSQVTGIEYPGGKSRESYRILLKNGEPVIATRRATLELARREINILRALNLHNAPVPKLLATNNAQILIQQEITGPRLSEALKHADASRYGELIASALDSLSVIHHAGTEESLESQVDVLGQTDAWIKGLLERPGVIGQHLNTPAPTLDMQALLTLLRIRQPQFIKWDSRPGNAVVSQTGRVMWFDWEHAGKRNRLDDMAWVLGDEFLPDYPDAENALIDQFIPKFAGSFSHAEAHQYLMAYGSFHMTVRIGLILKYMTGKWWDLDQCIKEDKVGVTLACSLRLCRRAARWSAVYELTRDLSPWFSKLESQLESL